MATETVPHTDWCWCPTCTEAFRANWNAWGKAQAEKLDADVMARLLGKS